jgi:hypothetical protein
MCVPNKKGTIRAAVYATLEKFGRDVPLKTLMEEVKRITGKQPKQWTTYTYRSEWLKVNRINHVDRIRNRLLKRAASALADFERLIAECPAA